MIPTAEEFLKDLQYKYGETGEYKMYFAIDIENKLRKFAKLHVTEALKSARENASITNDYGSGGKLFDCVDGDSILNAYPLDLIK